MDKRTQQMIAFMVCAIGVGTMLVGAFTINVYAIVSGGMIGVISLIMMRIVTKD